MLKLGNPGRIYTAMMTAKWFSLTALPPNILIMTAESGRHPFQRSGCAPSTRAVRVRNALHAHILRSNLAPQVSLFYEPEGMTWSRTSEDELKFETTVAVSLYLGFMGVEGPVSGISVSTGTKTWGVDCICATAGASAVAIDPPAAEGEIRLGIESSIG
jgi:hypothetical protein